MYNHGRLRFHVILLPLVLLLGLSLLAMLLWNALLPAIFGLPAIGFLQATGLMILSRLLFGGVGKHFEHLRTHERFHRKWDTMNPEEQASFMMKNHPFFRCRNLWEKTDKKAEEAPSDAK